MYICNMLKLFQSSSFKTQKNAFIYKLQLWHKVSRKSWSSISNKQLIWSLSHLLSLEDIPIENETKKPHTKKWYKEPLKSYHSIQCCLNNCFNLFHTIFHWRICPLKMRQKTHTKKWNSQKPSSNSMSFHIFVKEFVSSSVWFVNCQICRL